MNPQQTLFPSPTAAAPASTTDLRLVTFNAQHAAPDRARRQAAWLGQRPDADVVVLTEVGHGPGGHALPDALVHHGYPRFGRRRRTVRVRVPVLVCAPGFWLWVQLVRTDNSAGWLAVFGIWFVGTAGVGLLLASRRWLALLDRAPLAYHALRLDEIAHDPELHGFLSGGLGDAVDALDGAVHAARALQRRLDQQTLAGTAAADIAAYAASSAEQVRGDILRRVEEFLAIWAEIVKALGGTAESGPRPELSGTESRAGATRRPADLAEISGVLVGLARLALSPPASATPRGDRAPVHTCAVRPG